MKKKIGLCSEWMELEVALGRLSARRGSEERRHGHSHGRLGLLTLAVQCNSSDSTGCLWVISKRGTTMESAIEKPVFSSLMALLRTQ